MSNEVALSNSERRRLMVEKYKDLEIGGQPSSAFRASR